MQLAQRKAARRKLLFWLCVLLCAAIVAVFAALVVLRGPYLGWDYSDPELAIAGTAFHAFEWLFVRAAPILLIAAVAGIFMTWKRR